MNSELDLVDWRECGAHRRHSSQLVRRRRPTQTGNSHTHTGRLTQPRRAQLTFNCADSALVSLPPALVSSTPTGGD